jgi:ABC-type multidrug transport system fused ATPase/permease subunit
MTLISSKYFRAIALLNDSERRYLRLSVFLQSLLNVLDLLGVTLIGVITIISLQDGAFSNNSTLDSFITLLRIGNSSTTSKIIALTLLAGVLLITRTLVSIWLIRRTFHYLSKLSVNISANLANRVLNLPFNQVREFESQNVAYALTTGVERVTLGVIGTAVSVIGDMTLVLILMFGLSIFNPLLTLFTAAYFILVAYSIHRLSNERSKLISRNIASLVVAINSKIIEALVNIKDITVRGRRNYYVEEVKRNRQESSRFTSELAFMPFIGKYILESAIIIGALLLVASQLATSDSAKALSTLAVFLASSSRIAPAVLRVQQGLLNISTSFGLCDLTLTLHERVQSISLNENPKEFQIPRLSKNEPRILVENLSWRFESGSPPLFSDLNLTIDSKEFVAIIGPTGSGKSTLLDLLMGLRTPESGVVRIGGFDPSELIDAYPGTIGYVPQNIILVNGSILENLLLGFSADEVKQADIEFALVNSAMKGFIDSLPNGLMTQLGEWGEKISGGQKQRLGIARALISRPQVLFLDEPTSALDAVTESEFMDCLLNLRDKMTIIMVAHRLTTIRAADKLIYLSNGTILARGTFEEVRLKVHKFDIQVDF